MEKLTGTFELGQTVATCGVTSELTPADILILLRRHACGDWGELCEEDRKCNEDGLKHGDRLLSAYTVRGKKYWVITESDRSVTTVLKPDEY
jgi:hypothetical protein